MNFSIHYKAPIRNLKLWVLRITFYQGSTRFLAFTFHFYDNSWTFKKSCQKSRVLAPSLSKTEAETPMLTQTLHHETFLKASWTIEEDMVMQITIFFSFLAFYSLSWSSWFNLISWKQAFKPSVGILAIRNGFIIHENNPVISYPSNYSRYFTSWLNWA